MVRRYSSTRSRCGRPDRIRSLYCPCNRRRSQYKQVRWGATGESPGFRAFSGRDAVRDRLATLRHRKAPFGRTHPVEVIKLIELGDHGTQRAPRSGAPIDALVRDDGRTGMDRVRRGHHQLVEIEVGMRFDVLGGGRCGPDRAAPVRMGLCSGWEWNSPTRNPSFRRGSSLSHARCRLQLGADVTLVASRRSHTTMWTSQDPLLRRPRHRMSPDTSTLPPADGTHHHPPIALLVADAFFRSAATNGERGWAGRYPPPCAARRTHSQSRTGRCFSGERVIHCARVCRPVTQVVVV